MILNQNTSKLETILFDNPLSKGYSFRINAFEGWRKKNRLTYVEIGKLIGMSEGDIRSKLENKKKFNKTKINKLLKIMDDKDAFHIIYFPNFRIKTEVYKKLFNKDMKIKRRRVEEIDGSI